MLLYKNLSQVSPQPESFLRFTPYLRLELERVGKDRELKRDNKTVCHSSLGIFSFHDQCIHLLRRYKKVKLCFMPKDTIHLN